MQQVPPLPAMLESHISAGSSFAAQLPAQLQLIHLGKQQKSAQVLAFLPPTWETQSKFLAPGLAWTSPGYFSQLGSKPAIGKCLSHSPSLSLSLCLTFPALKQLISSPCYASHPTQHHFMTRLPRDSRHGSSHTP